jgi:hypothetical protein
VNADRDTTHLRWLDHMRAQLAGDAPAQPPTTSGTLDPGAPEPSNTDEGDK